MLQLLQAFFASPSAHDELTHDSDDRENTCTNDVLPMELLERVFTFLNVREMARAASTCRSYRRARWLRVDLAPHSLTITPEVLRYVLLKEPRVLLMPRAALQGRAAIELAACGAAMSLRELDLRGLRLDEVSFDRLSKGDMPVRFRHG